MKPNEQQARVIARPIDATVKVVAGAGTGKTGVLVERYLKLMMEDGIEPDRLLALTFTKKAAAEMQGRIFTAAAKRGNRDMLRSLYGAWIMNFHQFAYRVIKENAAEFGIDPDTSVASEVEIERTWRNVRRRFDSRTMDGLPLVYEDDMPPPNRMDPYFDRCKDIVDKARGTMWTPQQLMATVRPDDVAGYERYVQTVNAIWDTYETELHAQHLVDFNDLIRIVVDRLTRDESLRRSYRERFVHILVDEFQDTSEAQNELLRLLSGDSFPHTTVVGDEKQSIYRWRDARVENIREFEGEEEPLTLNYRSTQGILDTAFHLIAGDPYFAAAGESIHLQAHRGASTVPICVFHPPDGEAPSPEREAAALGAWIVALTSDQPPADGPFLPYASAPPRLAFDDIAILMRSLKPASGLPHYERELQRLRIPYAIVGGVSALEEGVLGLLKNVLRLIIYPNDVTALLAVVEARPLSVPDDALTEMFRNAERPHVVWSYSPVFRDRGLLSDAVLNHVSDDAVRSRLVALREFLGMLDQYRSQMDLAAFLTEALSLTQFHFRLFEEGGDLRLVGSLSRRIFELIEQLVQKGEPNLASFIESVETLLARKQFGEEDAPYVPEGRVVIMTQHQAKGLQFPAVAVPGIKKERGRSDGFYLVKGDGIYQSKWKNWNRGTENTTAREDEKLEREQEERCLLYVAMTRACDHLFLSTSFAGGVEKHGREKQGKPNLFASILETLRRGEIESVECREATPAQPVAEATLRGDEADLNLLVDEWHLGAERLGEARDLERPVEPGLHSVSWRGLHSFEQCPLQFRYRYVAGVGDDTLEGTPAGEREATAPGGLTPAQFGSFVHRFLYEWLSGAKPPAAPLLDDLTARFGLPEAARKPVAEATAAIADAYGPHVEAESVVQLEWPVRRRIGGVLFHGVIDRVDRVASGHRIVDYKVGAAADDYAYQIRFYSWIAGALLDGPVGGGAVAYLRDGVSIADVDVDDVDRVGHTAADLAEAVASGAYHASPGRVCEGCDYRSVCPHSVVEGAG